MDLQLSLQHLAAEHQLSDAAAARLKELAGIDAEPPALQQNVTLGLAILAAALGGLGIIFWIASNWETLGRAGRFALLQGLIVAMCTGAVFRPAARPALSLLAMLGIGGLFAYFGQTYQTGADPWQLFAIWAALALPLCLALRHDVLWAPWAIIAMTAVALWIHANVGRGWSVRTPDLPYHVAGWCAALLMVLALSPALRRFTGAGAWSMRVAVTLAACFIGWSGLFALLDRSVAPQFALGLALLVAAGAALCTARLHDTFALSAIGLTVNVLLVGGMVRWLLDDARGDPIAQTMLIGLVAAGLLAATVKLVIGVARKHAPGSPL
jgi:uncharacterized membrane protein